MSVFSTVFAGIFALSLLVGQEQAPAPGAAPPAPAPAAAQAAPGAAAPAGDPAQAPRGDGGGMGGMGGILFPLLLCFVVFYFLLILPERKKTKARKAMINAVKKGDQVVTTAGIIGKVIRVDDREVAVQVDKDNDVRMRFLKSAIHEVIPEGTEIKDSATSMEKK